MKNLRISNPSRILAIVPAAGVGSRAAARELSGTTAASAVVPKQYRLIAGRPMLWWSVRALLQDVRVDEVVVAVSANDSHVGQALAGLSRVRWIRSGGPSRYATVRNTLEVCGALDADWILVHDAARPGLPAESLTALVDACLDDDVGGLLALPVADTLKLDTLAELRATTPQSESGLQAGTEGGSAAQVARPRQSGAPRVAQTLPRDHLWQAQTPQMFRAGLLRKAFAEIDRLGLEPTDEAGSVEKLGVKPLLVHGSLINFKVTWPQDFEWIEKWLE